MNRAPNLHLVSNREICSPERFPDVAAAAVAGGVEAVHLREPGLERDELIAVATELKRVLLGTKAKIFINRDIELAMSVGAYGVHLPETELDSIQRVKGETSGELVFGVSVHSVDAAIAAERAGADYVIAGHVFETNSKPGAAGRGLAFVESVSDALSIPVIAIGGITPENTGFVLRAGADGVAVMSAILSADDPELVSMQFTRAISQVQGGL